MATRNSKWKRKQKQMTIPDRFEPRFWEEVDRRSIIYREVKRRMERLMNDTGANSYQKELLVQEAIFIAIQLETLKVKAAETGELDTGSYVQSVNCLQGLLSKLGLEKRMDEVITLKEYVNQK